MLNTPFVTNQTSQPVALTWVVSDNALLSK